MRSITLTCLLAITMRCYAQFVSYSPIAFNLNFNSSETRDYTPILKGIQGKLEDIDAAIVGLPEKSTIHQYMTKITAANGSFPTYMSRPGANRTEIEVTLQEIDAAFSYLSSEPEAKGDPQVIQRLMLGAYLQRMYREALSKPRRTIRAEINRYQRYFSQTKPTLDSLMTVQREKMEEAMWAEDSKVQICVDWGGTHRTWFNKMEPVELITLENYDSLITYPSDSIGNLLYKNRFLELDSVYRLVSEQDILREDGSEFKDRYRFLRYRQLQSGGDGEGCQKSVIPARLYYDKYSKPHYDKWLLEYYKRTRYLYELALIKYRVTEFESIDD